jgi:hypothetical protein
MDEDGERPDWIELHNRGANAVNLLGWSLTDDPDVPGQWTFPSRVLNPGEYLVVFASGKDRRAPAGANRFHTNFKLDLFGEYLALFNPEYPRVAASEFTPRFPEQRNNYSYGWIPRRRDSDSGVTSRRPRQARPTAPAPSRASPLSRISASRADCSISRSTCFSPPRCPAQRFVTPSTAANPRWRMVSPSARR